MTPGASIFCAHCGVEHAAVSSLFGSARPTPGAFSVCIECAEVSVFTHTLALRAPTLSEAKTIAGSIEIANARAALAAVKAQHEETGR